MELARRSHAGPRTCKPLAVVAVVRGLAQLLEAVAQALEGQVLALGHGNERHVHSIPALTLTSRTTHSACTRADLQGEGISGQDYIGVVRIRLRLHKRSGHVVFS